MFIKGWMKTPQAKPVEGWENAYRFGLRSLGG